MAKREKFYIIVNVFVDSNWHLALKEVVGTKLPIKDVEVYVHKDGLYWSISCLKTGRRIIRARCNKNQIIENFNKFSLDDYKKHLKTEEYQKQVLLFNKLMEENNLCLKK